MISVGGYRVSGLELENVLGRHSGIREVAVLGVPHPELGEQARPFLDFSSLPSAAAVTDGFTAPLDRCTCGHYEGFRNKRKRDRETKASGAACLGFGGGLHDPALVEAAAAGDRAQHSSRVRPVQMLLERYRSSANRACLTFLFTLPYMNRLADLQIHDATLCCGTSGTDCLPCRWRRWSPEQTMILTPPRCRHGQKRSCHLTRCPKSELKNTVQRHDANAQARPT